MKLNIHNKAAFTLSTADHALATTSALTVIYGMPKMQLAAQISHIPTQESFKQQMQQALSLTNQEQTTIVELFGTANNNHANNFLYLNLGNKETFSFRVYLKALKELAHYVSTKSIASTINIVLEPQLAELLGFSYEHYSEQTIVHFVNFMYSFNELKTAQQSTTLKQLHAVHFVSQQKIDKLATNALNLLDGIFLIKHLANNPANIVTPTYLAKVAKSFLQESERISLTVLDVKEIKKLGMNAFLAVTQGSLEPPQFICLEYRGLDNSERDSHIDAKKTHAHSNSGQEADKTHNDLHDPIVIVGKGITFDSGGISLKASNGMEKMKFDMCGAATTLALFLSVARLNLPINLVALVPTCENMPSGSATRPGDIVTTMSQQTVEILNTDAEGRLILCDALHYAKRYKPKLVIDIATLTGACVTALGHVAGGLYANDDHYAEELLKISNKTNDKLWRLPLMSEYHEMLTSESADIANISGFTGVAGSITAACYLEKFVDYKWLHLDIAGIAYGNSIFNSNGYHLATARPFYTLIEFLRKLSDNSNLYTTSA